MRTTFIFLTMLLAGSLVSAQEDETLGVYYGLNLGQVYTGSGHGFGYTMNSSVQKGRKSLEFGMIFKGEEGRISGGDVKYKIFLGPHGIIDNNLNQQGFILKPYIQYNFLYHSAEVDPEAFLAVPSKKSTTPSLPSSENTIATMEHFAGLGLQMMVGRKISLDGSMGFGTYIGSLNKFDSPNTLGIHKENHGFVLAFEFGMGYNFGL